MFTVVNSSLALVVLYLIWGFDWRIIKFDGIAKNADPSQIEQRKLKGYLRRYVRKLIKKELDTRDAKIAQLTRIIEKMQYQDKTLPELDEIET